MSDASLSSSRLPGRHRRWRTLLLALLIFISGGVVGGAGAVVFIARRVQSAILHPETLPERITYRLKRQLNLSDEEQFRVREAITKHQAKLLDLRRDVQPKVMTELDAMRDDISTAIDPARRAKWQALYTSLIDNWMPPLPPTTQP